MASLGFVSRGFCVLTLTFVPLVARGDDLSASIWKVKVDPSTTVPVKPASTDFAIPFPANMGNPDQVVYPTTPSPFVAIGRNFFAGDSRQIWDLSTKKLVGTLKGQLNYDEKSVALSGDGAYFAGKPNPRNTIEVRATKNGRVIQTIDLESPFLDFIDFAAKDRLVFGRLADRKLQVVDIKSGDPVCNIALFEKADRETIALSPGRAYLAAASSSDSKLRVYDLADGTLVGEAPTPRKDRQPINCLGLSFSPDGSELVGLFESFGQWQIVCWSVSDGKMTANFDLGKELQKPAFYKDQAIGWLPDGSAFLVLGYAIVDRGSGKKVWDLPFDNTNLKASPRRFLDNDHAMIVTHQSGLALRTAILPRDKIAGAVKIVKAGGNAADASLPPLIKADSIGAKAIDLKGKPPAWSLPPDGAAPAEVRLTARPVALKSKPDDYKMALFAGPGSSQAVVVGSPQVYGQANPTDGQPRWVERFDLATGKVLGKVEIPNVADPIAISTDGSSLILREAKTKDRIDVVTAEGKPIAGWRPYDQDSPETKAVNWAAFVDPSRVLTLSSGGTLILWSIPTCKAVYVAEDAFIGTPALSADRSMIAGFDGRGLRVLDVATGAWKGESLLPKGVGQRVDVKSLGFRPDGLEIAVVFNNSALLVWDLTTGQLKTQVGLSSPYAGETLAWADQTHVLLDSRSLIDLGTKREVWHFTLGSFQRPTGAAGPDGRQWAVLRGVLGQETGRFASFNPIDPSLEKVEALLADANAPCLLRPGSTVGIQLNFTGPPKDAPAFRQSVTDSITARLKKYGMNVNGQGAPTARPNATQVSFVRTVAPSAQLVINVKDKDTGRTLEYRRLGAGRGPIQTVKLVDLVCEMNILDAQGAVVWTESRTQPMQPAGFILRMPAGESDPETYLKKLQWEQVKKWAVNVGFPYFLARDGSNVLSLPGYTDLNR